MNEDIKELKNKVQYLENESVQQWADIENHKSQLQDLRHQVQNLSRDVGYAETSIRDLENKIL